MGTESPNNNKVETMRPQIAEDIGVSQSGEPHHTSEGSSHKMRASGIQRPSSISSGGVWGGRMRTVEDQMAQMERLRARRKKLREATVVSHGEMMQQDEDYKAIQQKIIATRKRLNAIAVNGEAEEKRDEVQRLRDELSRHFVAFRKAVQERKKQHAPEETSMPSQAELEARVDVQADALNAQWEQGSAATSQEKEPSVASSWNVTAKASYDDATLDLIRPKTAKTSFAEQWNVTPTVSYDTDAPMPILGEQSIPQTSEAPLDTKNQERAFEKRLQERAVWREKKHAFDTAYRSYIAQSASRKANRTIGEKLQFWKKEQKPEALVQLEKEYQDARRAYAYSLHGAILDRIDARNKDRETEHDKEILQAALANRFIITAAHDRLRSERESIPHVEGRRTLEKLHAVLQKNGKLIKAAGYVTVGGIALASGGVAVAVAALAGKAVQTKITTAFMAGGLTAGALAGNFIGDRIIAHKDTRREGALRNAALSFSSRSLDRLEVEYLDASRKHTKAVAQKKYIVGAGAAAGALGGALLAGNLEVPNELPPVLETPQVPPEPLTPFLPEEVPVQKPDDLLPEPPYPMPNMGPIEIDSDKIDNFEKGAEFKTDVDGEPDHEHHHEHERHHEHHHEHEYEIPSLLYTFEGGDVDTVSEALFETWKDNPALLDEDMSKSEFLAQMYGAIAEIEKNDGLRESLMTQMSISSGNIHEVLEGQTINLQPFFEYLNNKH